MGTRKMARAGVVAAFVVVALACFTTAEQEVVGLGDDALQIEALPKTVGGYSIADLKAAVHAAVTKAVKLKKAGKLNVAAKPKSVTKSKRSGTKRLSKKRAVKRAKAVAKTIKKQVKKGAKISKRQAKKMVVKAVKKEAKSVKKKMQVRKAAGRPAPRKTNVKAKAKAKAKAMAKKLVMKVKKAKPSTKRAA